MDSGEESSKQSLTERPSAGASSSPAQQKQQRGTTQRQQQFSAKFKTDLNRSVQEEFQPLLPLGRVSLLSELAGRGDLLINMNLEARQLKKLYI
ncbi:uncharacterized protein LOC114076559 isoform X3 [Solanum pennellii]|uniref:Uncharacterized protein LOC114076559 isoform X3 n=1 Tax=Solanum pennellii TaxID=28526 RepID=A0ABM1V7G6_SOLPN|nr:uncharacterized protein LOC114076559 isoform X3 [Solanum pennellii]